MSTLSVREREPLAAHTALRTGGPTTLMVAHTDDDLEEALGQCRERELRWTALGAGTRVVARDGGLAGAMIRLGTGFATLDAGDEVWEVGAALPVPALVVAATAVGRGGVAERLDTPGSLGASLVLDDWGDLVSEVRVLWRGRPRWRPPEAARRTRLVLGARLRLPLSGGSLRPELLGARGGWVSRDSRGDLVRSGLAGVRLRGVCLAEPAPELLVNVGGGTAADAGLLLRSALERVRRLRGVSLTSQVRWLGRHTSAEEPR